MVMRTPPQQRAQTALQRLARLNAEQQVLYTKMAQLSWKITPAEKNRLYELVREIALVQDERNRARCGAPPAPPHYDPLAEPVTTSLVDRRYERGYRKTSEEEVLEMRRLHTEEGLSVMQIWHEFNYLKESTVRDILKNRTWYDPDYTPPEKEKKPAPSIHEVVQDRTRRCDRMAG